MPKCMERRTPLSFLPQALRPLLRRSGYGRRSRDPEPRYSKRMPEAARTNSTPIGRLLARTPTLLLDPLHMNCRPSLLILALGLAASAFAQPPASVNRKHAQGRKQGPWEKPWADSQQLRYQGQFKDDKPVGTFTYFSTAGKVESTVAHYATGDASRARHFHPDGKLMAEGRYVGEQKDSIWN